MKLTELQKAAIDYAERNFSIFPCYGIRDGNCTCGNPNCTSPGKHPIPADGFKAATKDVETVKKWWEQYPDANIGYALPECIVVVDVDINRRKGKRGDETLAKLEATHGALPPTYTVVTGGGGKHFFFMTDTPLHCRNNVFPHIDIKTMGGYVILPPSNHISGNQYQWATSNGGETYAKLPSWIAAAVNGAQPAQAAFPANNSDTVNEGQRNEVLFKLASSMRARGLSETAMLAALQEENRQRCVPALSDKEIQVITHSAGKYRQGEVKTNDHAQEWEQPIPFGCIETPDFPTDALPEPIAKFVDALSVSTQTPNEMGAILSLGVLSTAFQKRYTVEVTPDWREQLSLYTVAIAPPGERKTAVISALMKPVYQYEATRREFETADIAQNKAEKATLEKALAQAQTMAAKKPENMEAGLEKVHELSAQLAEFEDMHPFRLVVDDTTPEKLVDLMDVQGGCITVASGEGGIFDSMAGRYDKGANFDIYLKGHAGDPISVERIGRSANYIQNPRLTMILTIQPEVLSGLMENATFKGRGLCGRFLYAVCKSKVGSRDVNPPSVPLDIKNEYDSFISRILGGLNTGSIKLSPLANALRLEYMATVEKRLGDNWEYMRDWGGKAIGAMIRIAGLIHAAEIQGDPTAHPIQPGILQAAIDITEFLGKHAEAAYQVMGADRDEADAKYLLKRMVETGQTEISRRDLFKVCQSHFGKAEAITAGLTRLEDMGYIRETEKTTGGRPSKMIMLNPLTNGTERTKGAA